MKTRLCILVTVAGLFGCGVSREGARDEASRRACNRYNQCGEVGAGKTFETQDACMIDQRAEWDGRWDAATCDGKINATELDICTKAIDITDCDNFFDFLVTIGDKCSAANVCSGGASDGG